MSSNLLFRLSEYDDESEEQTYEWLGSGHQIQRAGGAELAAYAHGRYPVLVVPGEHITLTRTKLPGRNRNTWMKAVPYALEDQLADDVEKLHFALGDLTPAGDIAVAVLRRQLLSDWLALCEQAGIKPGAVIPDYLLLPLITGNSWSLLLEDGRAIVRSGPWSGFACEIQLLAVLLKLALNDTHADHPQYLQLWSAGVPPAVTAAAGLSDLPLPLQQADSASTALEIFAAGYRQSALLNLLQGDYRHQSQWSQQLRPWKMAAVLAGVWFGSQLLQQGIDYWQLKREQTLLQQAMITTLREAVPEVRRIVNPQAQLENRLRELQGKDSTGVAAFFDLLRHGGQSLTDFQGVTLRGLRYKDNQLDLELEGDNLAVFDQLRQRLSDQAGLRVEMRVSKRENRVESRLTLNKG
jgi:general secretion pathway protein L